jgi:hypothetical protein
MDDEIEQKEINYPAPHRPESSILEVKEKGYDHGD